MLQRTCFRSWTVLLGVTTMPQNSPKRGVNRQFQAKTPKSIHRNISRTVNPTNNRFQDRVQTTKGTSWVVRHYPKANTTWLTAAILKIDITSYFRNGWSDLEGRPMQNNTAIKVKWSRSKPEVEFQEVVISQP